MRDRADLHIHSTASDGLMTPSEIIREAVGIGLGAISIVDHDTLAGVEEAQEAADRLGIDYVPGVEINTDYGRTEAHILGYFVDPTSPPLLHVLKDLRDSRMARGEKMVRKLRDVGVRITMDRVMEIADGAAIGRPHVAKAICEAGAASGMNAAFGKYLVRGAPGFVSRSKLSATDAIAAVLAAGGVPCLAHPGKVGWDGIVAELAGAGLCAIEAYHTDHTKSMSKRYARMGKEHGLVVTGGSDSHGPGKDKPVAIGHVTVAVEAVIHLREARSAKNE